MRFPLITIFFTITTIFCGIVVFDESELGFSARFSLPDIDIKPVRNGEFVRLSASGAGIDGDIGAPEILAYRYVIELPPVGLGDAYILSATESVVDLEKPLYPRQESRFKSRPEPPFAYDAEKYLRARPTRVVEIRELGILRGRRLGELIIRPVSYDPINSELKIKNNLVIEVSLKSPIEPISPRYASRWADDILSRALIYPTAVPRFAGVLSRYLIITTNAYAPHLDEFVRFKEQQGFVVSVATTDTIGTSDTLIKAFVQNAYDSWRNPPDFLLIVGDVADVRTYSYGTSPWSRSPSDQFYAMVDGGDYFPDIACGRFSVQSLDDLNAIIDKTIRHGRFEFDETSWLRRVVFPACGTDGDYELAMNTHRYVVSNYIHSPDFDADSVFAYFGATSADLIASINRGATVIDYSGHGSETSWSNPSLRASDIPSLTNDGKCPIVISNACLTNKFNHSSPCFGEVWTRVPVKGAVVHIGGTNSTMWDEDDWWERAVFDAIFRDNYWTTASLVFIGNLAVQLHGSSRSEYYFYIYHVLGDPSLGAYWGDMREIDAEVPEMFPIGVDRVEISAQESTIVSVWLSRGSRGSAISIGGIADVSIEPEPATEDTAVITYFLPNFYRPIWEKVPVYFLANVLITPEYLTVLVPSDISVFVSDSVDEPYPGVKVILRGFAVEETTFTNSAGYAMFHYTPPYAETLLVVGELDGGRSLFRRKLPVIGGTSFHPLSIDVGSPSVRISDSLAVAVEGFIRARFAESPFSWRIEGVGIFDSGTVLSGDTLEISVNPSREGVISLLTSKEGYAVGRTSIKSAICRGPLFGTVSDSAGVLLAHGVSMRFYPTGSDTHSSLPSATASVNIDGTFNAGASIILGNYDLYLSGFGWRATALSFTHHADGGYDFRIGRAPTGDLSGLVSDPLGAPIQAEILLLDRSGKMLYKTSSDETGNYFFGSIPFYTYKIFVSARGYNKFSASLDMNYSPFDYDITLSPVSANVLLIGRGGGSATDSIASHLASFGLTVDRKTALPALDSLDKYEVLIYSCGGNTTEEVYDAVESQRLLDAHNFGTKILIEGGEVAWQYSEQAPAIVLDSLLMIANWVSDDPDTTFILNSSPIGAYSLAHNPSTLPNTITPRSISAWTEYEYFDVIQPGASKLLYFLTGFMTNGCKTYFPDTIGGGTRRMAHFFFKYDNSLITAGANKSILKNVIEWLRPPDFSKGILLGRASVPGHDPSNITVLGGGDSTRTQTDGRFRLAFIPPGTSEVKFMGANIADTTFYGITVGAGEIRTGDIFTLRWISPVVEAPMPGEFALKNVFPNPFNGKISFDIAAPSAGDVSIEIFDLNGRRVLREVRSVEKDIVFVWDTSRDFTLASGIFLYKIEGFGKIISGKALLVK